MVPTVGVELQPTEYKSVALPVANPHKVRLEYYVNYIVILFLLLLYLKFFFQIDNNKFTFH